MNQPVPPISEERTARIPRPVGIAAAWVCVIAAAVVAVALAVEGLDRVLPTGNRTSVSDVSPSDLQQEPGTYWYTLDQAEALSAELAAATEGTDWCVGWSIVLAGVVPYEDIARATPYTAAGVQETAGFSSSTYGEYADVGSSQGPGRSARDCQEWAEIEVVYEYTSTTGALEDNAAMQVWASDTAITEALRRHPALDLSADDLLHEDRGDNTDDVIANTIAALPQALAEQGAIDPLSVEPVAADTQGAVSFDDAEGEGGMDALITNRIWLLAGAFVVLGGLLLLCMALAQVPARWFQPATVASGPRYGAAPAPGWGYGPTVSASPRKALKQQMARSRPQPPQAWQPPLPTLPPPDGHGGPQ
jgi:hypothetical protein